MQIHPLSPAHPMVAKPNPPLIVATMVAAHQDAHVLGQTLRLAMEDSERFHFPHVVALNAPAGASERDVQQTKTVIAEAHAEFASTTTFVADTGRYENGTPGLWRRDMFRAIEEVWTRYLDDGGDTVVVMNGADARRYVPKGHFFKSFADQAEKTGYSRALYAALVVDVDTDLPPRLRDATELFTQLTTECVPFVPEDATGIPLSLYRGTTGFDPASTSSEGVHLAMENQLHFTRAPDTVLFTSDRHFTHALAAGTTDFLVGGFGPHAPHRSGTLPGELTEPQHQQMMEAMFEWIRERIPTYFARGNYHDIFFGDTAPERRRELRDFATQRADGLFAWHGRPDLGLKLQESIVALDVDTPFPGGEAHMVLEIDR